MLEHVNITNNELQACDGFKAIIIKNQEIPAELKNTRIHWSIRENFAENLGKLEGDFLNIRAVFPKKEDAKNVIEKLTSESFCQTLNAEVYEDTEKRQSKKFTYKNFEIAVNTEYLDDVLMVLRNKEFTAYLFTSVSPIFIEAEDIEILLMPIIMGR